MKKLLQLKTSLIVAGVMALPVAHAANITKAAPVPVGAPAGAKRQFRTDRRRLRTAVFAAAAATTRKSTPHRFL